MADTLRGSKVVMGIGYTKSSVCPQCGKKFSHTAQHVYKRNLKDGTAFYCSYTCFRAAQKEYEELRNARLEEVRKKMLEARRLRAEKERREKQRIEKQRMWNRNCRRRLRERRIQSGLCVECGKPNNNGKTTCDACIEKRTRNHAERHDRLIQSGLCCICGKRKLVEGLTMCAQCAQRERRRAKRNYQRKKKEQGHDREAKAGRGDQEKGSTGTEV